MRDACKTIRFLSIADAKSHIIQLTYHITDAGVCDPNPCQNGGTCLKKSNTFVCQCNQRFEGPTCAGWLLVFFLHRSRGLIYFNTYICKVGGKRKTALL